MAYARPREGSMSEVRCMVSEVVRGFRGGQVDLDRSG
jgi:hypothetical protein